MLSNRTSIPLFLTLFIFLFFLLFLLLLIAAPWGVTLGLLGGWLVYPTLTSEFKGNFGMEDALAPGVGATISVKYTKEGIGSTPEVSE